LKSYHSCRSSKQISAAHPGSPQVRRSSSRRY
jgi:hypothetical protein